MSNAQRVIKYFAFAFAISLIVGIFFGIYMALISIAGISKNDKTTYKDIFTEYDENMNVLQAELGATELIIKEGDVFKVETNNKYINVKQDLNRISITERSHNKFKVSKESEVIVYVPKELIFEAVNIKNGAGEINVDYLHTKTLDLKLGAGEININDIEVEEKASINSGAGEVNIDSSLFNNLSLECGVGEIDINTILKGDSKIKAGIGKLVLNLSDSIDNYSLDVDKGLGSIEIDKEQVKNEVQLGNGENSIRVNGGIGEIQINFGNKVER